jgi:hypothetical protein
MKQPDSGLRFSSSCRQKKTAPKNTSFAPHFLSCATFFYCQVFQKAVFNPALLFFGTED